MLLSTCIVLCILFPFYGSKALDALIEWENRKEK